MVRSHFYIWAVCTIAPARNNQKKNVRELSDRYKELRQTIKGKDALARILFKTTRMLYRKFIKELNR